jgi:RNA polymerase sigma-70 factor, ECF subfamily
VHADPCPRPPPSTGPPPPGDALSAALEETIGRFRGLILSVGRRHGLEETDVDEVLQDVRVRLWHRRGDPETLRGLGASYVYRTAVTAALDALRRRRARRTGRDAVQPLDEATAATDGPDVGAEGGDLADRVFRRVAQLLPSRRPVVRMYLAGYERDEIARALGWSVGKVRNLLSRGLADLRALLERDGIGPEGWR